MARRCTVCSHKQLEKVEEHLGLRRPLSVIAQEFGVSVSAITRHKQHMVAKVSESIAHSDESELTKLRKLVQKVLDSSKDPKVQLIALQRMESLHALELRVGQNHEDQTILTNHPAWQLFLKQLLGIVNDCTKCSAAITGIVPGDTRAE